MRKMKDSDWSALIAKLHDDSWLVLFANAVTMALEDILKKSRLTAAAAVAMAVVPATNSLMVVAFLKHLATSRCIADLEAAVAVPPQDAS
jgi:hypothetical protein